MPTKTQDDVQFGCSKHPRSNAIKTLSGYSCRACAGPCIPVPLEVIPKVNYQSESEREARRERSLASRRSWRGKPPAGALSTAVGDGSILGRSR